MKIVYIAHPIGGDVKENIIKVTKIIRQINILMPDICPFAHYIVDCLSLDDSVLEERNRGIRNDTEFLKRGFVDEIWLWGDRISNGMRNEIKLAKELGIKIVAMTKETEKELKNIS